MFTPEFALEIAALIGIGTVAVILLLVAYLDKLLPPPDGGLL